MQFNIHGDVVELRSEPNADGTFARRIDMTAAETYTITAETDVERVLVRPLFHEFAAKVFDTLDAAGLLPDTELARGAAQAHRDTAEVNGETARRVLAALDAASRDTVQEVR